MSLAGSTYHSTVVANAGNNLDTTRGILDLLKDKMRKRGHRHPTKELDALAEKDSLADELFADLKDDIDEEESDDHES